MSRLGAAALAALLVAASGAHATEYQVLYAFSGNEGYGPRSAVVMDTAGTLYGTTQWGGGNVDDGGGTLFKLSQGGQLTVLHGFSDAEGENPAAGPILDAHGNLFGTLPSGLNDTAGGAVYRVLRRRGAAPTFRYFTKRRDGASLNGRLLLDDAGNLFGTTSGQFGTAQGGGTVFRLAPSNKLTVLYTFEGHGADGGTSEAGLVADQAGNLYGTTDYGGDASCPSNVNGCGVVFKIAGRHKETVLHAFGGWPKNDGSHPVGDLLLDEAGNLYGTTSDGGNRACTNGTGCGTVFKLAPDGTETLLHVFKNEDGRHPTGGLVRDEAGNLYGTAQGGGDLDKCLPIRFGCGVVFKIAPDGTYTILHTFEGDDGSFPSGTLMFDQAGNLYGTAASGGTEASVCPAGCGVVFKLTP